MSLTSKITVRTQADLETVLDLVTARAQHDHSFVVPLTTTDADNVFSDTRTLAASTGEDLDLSGSLTNAIGASVAFTKVKAIVVEAAGANGGNIVIGGAASNGFVSPFGSATDKVKVPAGGIFVLATSDSTGFAVTAATADLLHIANDDSGAAATYNIFVIGKS